MPPSQTIALNLARIVHRLATQPRGWRVDQLQHELDIADRTYRKYRQLLQEKFPPFRAGNRSQVKEVQEGEARYLRLVDGEPDVGSIHALLQRLTAHHLARELLGFLSHPAREALDEAFQAFVSRSRLERRFPMLGRLQRDLGRLFYSVPDAPKNYQGREAVLGRLLEALLENQRVLMRYDSAARGMQEHTLEPLTLAVHRGGLYLFARYVGRKRVYNFVVDRIKELELLDESFSYPPAHEYSPEKITSQGFGIFFQDRGGGGPRHKVELLFADKRWLHLHLQERSWARDQRFQPEKDGRLRLTFSVGDLTEVISWVRSFGDDVTVVSPRSLRG